jgi:tetratricopeptide (TPR) repeat protein
MPMTFPTPTGLFTRAALCLCLLSAALETAGAQVSALDQFDEFARRAESLLDSQPAEAASLYKQALALRPAWAEGWLYLGASLYQTSRYAEASDAFRKGIKLAPGVGTAWAFLGLCEAELEDYDQALADIRKGEDLGLGANRPFEITVRVRAARLYIRSSAFEEAQGQLYVLSKANVSSPALVETMGLIALGISQNITELSPQRRAVVSLAGKAAWASACQHPAESAAAYKELLETYPNEPGVHYAYGLYLQETDVAATLAEYEKEISLNPYHWLAMLGRASLKIRQGEPDAAVPSLQAAMKLVPSNYRWICHAELGRAGLTADKLDVAVREFEIATRQMPSNAQLHFFLSQAYRRSGRKEDAQRETEQFDKLKVQQDPLGVPALRPFSMSSGKN